MSSFEQQKHAVFWLRVIYPLWAAVGMFSLLYVPGEVFEANDPGATVANIVSREWLFRAGISGSLITQLFNVAAVWFLYKLFYPSYKDAVLLMAVFAFLGMPVAMYSTTHQLAALDVLHDAEQAYLFLQLNTKGTMIATIFWGLWLLPLGYMIIRSPLFPQLIGWLVVLAGAGYTIAAFAYFMGAEGPLMNILEYLTIGEVIWMLWVLFMGARWEAIGVTNGGGRGSTRRHAS